MNDAGGFTYRYTHGEFRGRAYYVGVRADPGVYRPASFAVVLFYEDDDGEAVEVAKVDNTEHREGDIHVDRFYRAAGAPRKDFDVNISSLPEAEAFIRQHWRRFARIHARHAHDRDS